MTPAGRFGSAVRHTLPPSSHVGLQCRFRASTAIQSTNPSISLTYTSRRRASWLNTDKLRKKIWGTENPPGQEDPYGKESAFDRERREREQENEEKRRVDPVPEEELESALEGGDEQYVPATTAEGLERVGDRGWGRDEWEAENSFQGFMESEKTEHRKDVVIAVHRALVETYTLIEAGLPLVMDYYSMDPTEDYAKRVAESAKFEQDSNGKMALVLESEELRHSILSCVTPQEHDNDAIEGAKVEDEEVEEQDFEEQEFEQQETETKGADERPFIKEDNDSNLESEGSEQLDLNEEPINSPRPADLIARTPASDTWRNVSFQDPAIKFAVLKRVMQLTGKRVPDPDISVITTPGSLIVHLVKKPKPKKIAEALQKANPVVQLPNVQILNRRHGPIDRDIELGRWKVIKKELEKRGLRATGRAALRNTMRAGRL